MFYWQGVQVVAIMGSENDGRNQPILRSQYPIRMIHQVSHANPSPSIDNSVLNMHSRVFVGCKVEINDIEVHRTNCSGSGCDQQGLLRPNGTVETSCCCQLMHQFSVLGIACNYQITLPSGDLIEVHNHMSRLITNVLMLTEPIRAGTTLLRVQNKIAGVYGCYSNVLQHINDNGGFIVTLWMKRGRSLDRSVPADTANGYGRQERQYVVSDTVHYHIVSLVPTNPASARWDEIYGMKYDSSKFDLDE
jgi:hypothetical protein